ncbi:MAG TPA: gamma-glutamyltransferase [Gammaproteobacteria bacterium]|nr:gamma-glutamyltransferase [Gammaproteobacteria bacterium]
MFDKRLISALVVCSAIVSAAAAAPARPPQAAIASAHPLATAAGMEVLEAGGNAFDAAVAVAAALGVVEPFSSGLGGGGFYLLHRAADGFEVMIDGRECAPRAAHRDMFVDAQGNVVPERAREGALAAAIPGTPAALAHIARRYGRLPLARSLAPAVRLAREGFPVDARLAAITAQRAEFLKRHGHVADVYLLDGRAPREGEILRNPALAATLEALGADGGESFYRGAIARRLVDGVRAAGGIWTLDDLRQYRVVERAPLRGEYRGLRITTASPPSSGGVVLIDTLNILAGYDLAALDAVTRKHLIVEAWRRAYRDRAEFLGDPDFVPVPIELLTHPFYAAGQRNSIRFDRALPSAFLPAVLPAAGAGANTTHFSILDAEGNRVAGTQTINFRYGSGVMPPGTGVVLNNEMDDFSAKPGVPNGFALVQGEANTIAPGKRPLSSMAPTFIESERGVAILGTPGGSRIISMVTLAVLDYAAGGGAASLVRVPRFHHQFLPDEIQYEPGGLTAEERAGLAARGHVLKELPRRYGNMNVVVWDYEDNRVEVATDPRNEAVVDF